MAYYSSHNHNLAYDLILFEDDTDRPVARRGGKKGEESAASEGAAKEKRERSRAATKKQRVKETRRKRNFGRIAIAVVLSIAVMAVIVSIIHGQVRLTELNQEIIDARAQLAEKQSIYTQLEMKVDSSVSTTVVEQYAKDNLSMSKANNSQKEFVSLSDGDKAEVTMSEDKNIFERIGDAIASLWS